MLESVTSNPFAGSVHHHHAQDASPSTEAEGEHDPSYQQIMLEKMLGLETIRKVLKHPEDKKTLWEALDEGRKLSHAEARKNHFLSELFKGIDFCQSQFFKYLVNLLPIHQALEKAQNNLLEHAHLKHFVMPELFRSTSIEEDLKIWRIVADPKFTNWEPCETATNLAKYILQFSEVEPEAFVGILYALYGTIMSGGQTNKLQLQKKLAQIKSYTAHVPEGSGVAFYEIKREGRILNDVELAAFKQEWHKNLCLIQDLLPEEKRKQLEFFQGKILCEMKITFGIILSIIQTNVEDGHC